MKADLLDWTGRIGEAWQARYASLGVLRSSTDDQRRRLICVGAAFAAQELGEPEAALVFANEAVAIAARSPDPLAAANAHLKRASLYGRMGRHAAAEDDLSHADPLVDRIADEDRRRLTQAQLRLEQGRLRVATAPEQARAALEEALAITADGEAALLLPEIEVELAKCDRSTGRWEEAEVRLRKALGELSRERSTVNDDYERIRLSEQADAIDDQLVDLLLDRGRPAEALAVASMAKARRLQERIEGDGGAAAFPPEVAATQATLTADTAIVFYTVLADRVVVWTITRDDLRTTEIAVNPPALQRLILEARAQLHDDAVEARRRWSGSIGSWCLRSKRRWPASPGC